MSHQDQLFRFIFEELDIRGELIYLESSWQEVLARYAYPENVQQQLGEAMAAVAILSTTIKFDGSLILQVQGDGPMNLLVVQASSDGEIRGLAKWNSEVPQGKLADVYGQGQIVITVRDKTGKFYQSIVELTGDNLGAALESYFVNSEQLKSHFWLFVDKNRVAGMFLQELPSQGDLGNLKNTKLADWERVNILANTTRPEELFELSPEEFLHRLFNEEKVRLYDPELFQFQCACSRSSIENSLLAMGLADLEGLLKEKGEIEADCEFCNQHYVFTEKDIAQLFATTTH